MAAAAIAMAIAASRASASGHAINDQGARAMGFGLATAATFEGPETLYYNPAGLARLEGWNLAAGVTLLSADFDSTPEETAPLEYGSSRDRFVVPHLYLGRRLGERWAAGLSVNAPFGLATEWPEDFPGRFVSRIADLRTVQLGLLGAVSLPGGWSLGFGPTVTSGDVRLPRNVDLHIFQQGHEGVADLEGDGQALGWRIGTRWRGESGWSFGLAAHGEKRLRLRGTVDYTVPPVGAFSLDQALANLFQDGSAATTLTLPMSATAGVGRAGARWTWEVDATWTHWSVMKEVKIDLQEIIADGIPFVLQEFVTNNWSDAWALRGGARRRVGEHWTFSVGAYLDATPVPVETADPLLPDSDRFSVTGGGTWTRGAFTLDFAGQLVDFDGLDTRGTTNALPARDDTGVLGLAVTAGWSWGRR